MALPRLICLLLVALCAGNLRAQEPLRWKFNAGDSHHYRLTQKMDMELSLGAANRTVESEFLQVVDFVWTVEQVDDAGRATISQTVDRLQMDLHSPGDQHMHFDTDSEESPSGFAAMLSPLVRALTNEPITFSISPYGEIDDLELPESIAKSMQAIPGAKMLGDLFNEDGFKRMLQQSVLVLPKAGDLQPGFQWTRESKLHNEQIGDMQHAVTYRYDGTRENDEVALDVFSLTVQTDFDRDDGNAAMNVREQQSQGEAVFNREVGYLQSSDLEQQLTLSNNPSDGVTTQKMSQHTTFERIDNSTETDE